MTLRRAGIRAVELATLVVIAGLLLGAFLGHPVMFGFVETGSMSPTMEPNDGFVAIPDPVAGEVSEGDVVVFDAQHLHGGGLTTHRVVETTDDGYITKGDGNPFTDQDGNEPLVQDDQIVAHVLQVNGHVVTLPGLGHLVGLVNGLVMLVSIRSGLDVFGGPQSILFAVFGASLFVYAYLTIRERTGSSPPSRGSRHTFRERGFNPTHLIIGVVAIVVLVATMSMVVPSGDHQFSVDTVGDGVSPGALEPGETVTETIHVPNSGYLPQVVVFETHDDAIAMTPSEQRLGARDVGEFEVEATAAPEPGTATYDVSEHRYWAVLPTSTIATLHGVHPWVALTVINAVIAVPFYALGRLLLGRGRLRTRTSPTVSKGDRSPSRLRRLIRTLY